MCNIEHESGCFEDQYFIDLVKNAKHIFIKTSETDTVYSVRADEVIENSKTDFIYYRKILLNPDTDDHSLLIY